MYCMCASASLQLKLQAALSCPVGTGHRTWPFEKQTVLFNTELSLYPLRHWVFRTKTKKTVRHGVACHGSRSLQVYVKLRVSLGSLRPAFKQQTGQERWSVIISTYRPCLTTWVQCLEPTSWPLTVHVCHNTHTQVSTHIHTKEGITNPKTKCLLQEGLVEQPW